MPTAIRVAAPIATSSVSVQKKAERNDLVLVALFSGVGLLISLVAILVGFQIGWY